MHKKRHATTQTEVDALYEKAEAIVKNFDHIESYWRKVERTNHILLGCVLSLGAIIVTITKFRRS